MNTKGTKRSRVMAHYNGHKGPATISHVERNIETAYPGAYSDLTGIQYGKLMSVANTSYQDGKHSNGPLEIWAYDGPLDWLAGTKDHVVEVNNDTVTITLYSRTDKEIKRVYKLA